VIRFGIVLSVVLIAIGLLVTGVVAGSLLLVVISIGVALLAFLLLIGVVISFRHEIFGRTPVEVAGAQVSPRALAGSGAKAPSSRRDGPAMAASRPGADTATRAGRVPPAEAAERRRPERSARPPADVDDRGRGKQQPARPLAKPAASAAAAGGGQQAAAARNKAQQAPFARAPRRDAPAAATSSAPLANDEPAEPQTAQRERARSEQAAKQASDARGAPNLESTDRERLANQHGARRLDRPGAEQQHERGQAEPRRASRLERESARAAGSRQAAPGSASSRGTPETAPEKPDVSRSVRSEAAAAGSGAASSEAAGAEASATTPRAAAAASAGPPAKPAEPVTDEAVGDGSANRPGTAGKLDAQGPDAAARKERAASSEPVASQPAMANASAAGGQPDRRPEGPARADDDEMQVSVVPGITRYHRGDCLLIRFLSADDLEVMTKSAASEGGCVPCKACKPDQAAPEATTS